MNAQDIVKKAVDLTPGRYRLDFLRKLMEEAKKRQSTEYILSLSDQAPLLSLIDVDYVLEGGCDRFVDTVTLTLVTGETHYFRGSEELDSACADQLSEFEIARFNDCGLGFDWNIEEHRQAFFLWMEGAIGVVAMMEGAMGVVAMMEGAIGVMAMMEGAMGVVVKKTGVGTEAWYRSYWKEEEKGESKSC